MGANPSLNSVSMCSQPTKLKPQLVELALMFIIHTPLCSASRAIAAIVIGKEGGGGGGSTFPSSMKMMFHLAS